MPLPRGGRPSHPGPTGRPRQPRLVAPAAQRGHPPPARRAVQPHGGRLRLRRSLPDAGPRRRRRRPEGPDDRLAGLVAGRLRPLRPPLHPHGLARRWHLPHPGRPRRRRHRQPALRPAQQLAGQRQPRQGPPPAVAHQAEIRQQAVLGRPVHPDRQRGAGVHGLQDLRFRRWPPRHLGARGRHQLGPGSRMAGHQRQGPQPLQR